LLTPISDYDFDSGDATNVVTALYATAHSVCRSVRVRLLFYSHM